MVAIGLALAWGSYTVGIWGYCLVRGYDVGFTQLFGAAWPVSFGGGTIPGTPSPVTGGGDIGGDTFT
jgi:hypothetical protein